MIRIKNSLPWLSPSLLVFPFGGTAIRGTVPRLFLASHVPIEKFSPPQIQKISSRGKKSDKIVTVYKKLTFLSFAEIPVVRRVLPDSGELCPRQGRDGERMKKILADIQNGSYAKEFMEEFHSGSPNFTRMRKESEGHLIEKVGHEIRSAFNWGDKEKLIDRKRN